MKPILTPTPPAGKTAVQILLVEDNPSEVRLFEEMLKNSKFPVRLNVVDNGEKAVDYLRGKPPYGASIKPDLVLLDLDIPRLNGHEVVAEVRRWRDINSIPLLILTGSDHDADRWKACESRVDAYLLKPRELSQYDLLMKYLEEHWLKDIPLSAGAL